MNTAARKQREWEEREALILDHARRQIIEGGYFGLNMDRVAEAIQYSKGTVYKHFATKEDLILGVAARSKQVRSGLFERASAFDGTTRERMHAIGVADELFARLHREHFQIEHLVRIHSVWEKTSEERRELLHGAGRECLDYCFAILGEAIARGDLPKSEPELAPLMMGLHAMSLGAHMLADDEMIMANYTIPDVYVTLRHNQTLFLDAQGWTPLSTEWDYEATYARITTEVFPDEMREVNG